MIIGILALLGGVAMADSPDATAPDGAISLSIDHRPDSEPEPEAALESAPEPAGNDRQGIDLDPLDESRPDGGRSDIEAEISEFFSSVEPVGHWWLDISALTEAGTAAGDVRAGAEVMMAVHGQQEGGIGGVIVPWMSGDGEIRLESRDNDQRVGASLHAESRLLDPRFTTEGYQLRFLPFDMHFDLDWHARPDLSSRRQFWRRPYTRQSTGGEIGFFNPGVAEGLMLGHVGLSFGTVEQSDGDEVMRQNQFEITFALASYTRERELGPDFQARFLAIEALGIENLDGPDANIATIDFVRLAGVPTGLGLYIDVEGGVAASGGTLTLSSSTNGEEDWSTTVTTEDLPHLSMPAGRARIHGTGASVSGAIEASRSMYLTADIELAIEERITASGRWLNRHGELSVQGFVSRNELWLDKETSEESLTGGVLAGWRHPLGEELTLTGSIEVARSFYASLRDDPRPRSELGVNIAATLTRHFGTSWRER